MKGLILAVDDDGYRVEEFDGGLAELQTAVGGYIEAAPTSDDVTLWCNDEHKLDPDLPVNRLAMDVWIRYDIHRCMLAGDWLAGNCVLTGGADLNGVTLDLPDEHRRWALRIADDAGARVNGTNR